jgi:hypothetical protein
MRKFDTGATRDQNDTKPDYAGFLSPLVIKGYGQYMHKHRLQADGTLRSSSNWKKGMSKDVYLESMWRHFLDVWLEQEGYRSREGLDEAMYGLLFNVMGYIHETEKERLTKCKHQNVIVNYGEDKTTNCTDCGEEIVTITPSTDWIKSFNKMVNCVTKEYK